MTTEEVRQIGRLAMRVESDLWVAYYAMPDTMDGAVFLGSIAMRFVGGDSRTSKRRKVAFMHMMKEAVADLIEEKVGQRPTWPNKPQAAYDISTRKRK